MYSINKQPQLFHRRSNSRIDAFDVTVVPSHLSTSEAAVTCIQDTGKTREVSGLCGEFIDSYNGVVDNSIGIAGAAGSKNTHASPTGFRIVLSAGIADSSQR